jgi:alkyldihydroxyacetonephosphate synthase
MEGRLQGLGARWGAVDASALPPPRPQVLAARGALAEAVGGRLSFADFERLSYARDLWPLALLWIRQGKVPPPPDVVVWPSTEAQVCQVVAVARAQRLALIPYGAGSGVCGGTWAIHGGITLDLKRFDRIGPIDEARRRVEVGAGVLGETLERALNARGWTLGHFPSSIACSSVGGWLAARSAGQLSSKYGKIEDMVLSLRAVLGTGELLVTPERPFSGPDLAPVLLGSEGTLCAFTGATLRVFPLPEGRVFHGFEFGSVGAGLEAIRLMFREGLRPAVVRLYDPFDTAFVGRGGAAPRRPPEPPSARGPWARSLGPALLRQLTRQTLGRPRAMNQLQRVFSKSRLILMFEGDAQRAEAEDRAATSLCRQLGADDLGEAPGRAWLAKRYDVSFRMSRLIDSGSFADTMEIAAPWERVQEVYERVHAAASPFAFVLCHFSHAYADGCSLYFSFVGSGADEAEIEARYHGLWRAALAAAVSAGGNVSHHHGVGILKAQALQDALGEGRHALAALKALFDPDGIMNPGKLGLGP